MAITLSKSGLADLLRQLAGEKTRVIAPANRGAFTEFAEIRDLGEADLSRVNTRGSIKQFFMPPSETILKYSRDGKAVKLDRAEPPKPRPTVIVGGRPCDAASLPIVDKVFRWDCDDQFWLVRREATVVMSISCTDCDECCFCTALGLAPHSTEGSDLLLTPIAKDEYLVEAVTDKGRALVKANKDLFPERNGAALDKNAACKAALAKLPPAMDLGKVKAWLDNHFDDEFWGEASLKCIGCGCCTFLCPTCHCFDIVDEATGDRGLRRKNWDACQFAQFTLHASGHNPRPDRASRWRQRVMHKFSYYVDRFGPRLCVGCGRCIRSCPVQMNISQQLRTIEKMQVP